MSMPVLPYASRCFSEYRWCRLSFPEQHRSSPCEKGCFCIVLASPTCVSYLGVTPCERRACAMAEKTWAAPAGGQMKVLSAVGWPWSILRFTHATEPPSTYSSEGTAPSIPSTQWSIPRLTHATEPPATYSSEGTAPSIPSTHSIMVSLAVGDMANLSISGSRASCRGTVICCSACVKMANDVPASRS